MINEKKYEGHTPGPWKVESDQDMDGFYFIHESYNEEVEGDYSKCYTNSALIADAPLLLAEVKRLRGVMIYVEQRQPHPALEWALKEGLTLTEIKERIE